MAELGIRPDVIELVLGRIDVSGSRSGVAGVYNKSELMPERKAALERWAAHIEGLAAGRSGNVVSLRGSSSTTVITANREIHFLRDRETRRR